MSSTGNQRAVPFISTDQMREVDRAMMCDYGILLIQMLENAGRELAHLARSQFLGGDSRGRKVIVLAGPGGNGGDGLVCARRLHNWGAEVRVWLTAEASRFGEVTRHQLTILEHMGVPIEIAGDEGYIPPADLIVDALIGYNLSGTPRGAAVALIRAANGHRTPVLAPDVPSGVDSATGTVFDPAVWAKATLALPKEALRGHAARLYVGELYLADISVPPGLYSRPPLSLEVGPVFAGDGTVRLWRER